MKICINIFVWSNFYKIGCVLIYIYIKLVWWKTIKVLRKTYKEKHKKTKLAKEIKLNEKISKIFAASFSFGEIASLY